MSHLAHTTDFTFYLTASTEWNWKRPLSELYLTWEGQGNSISPNPSPPRQRFVATHSDGLIIFLTGFCSRAGTGLFRKIFDWMISKKLVTLSSFNFFYKKKMARCWVLEPYKVRASLLSTLYIIRRVNRKLKFLQIAQIRYFESKERLNTTGKIIDGHPAGIYLYFSWWLSILRIIL